MSLARHRGSVGLTDADEGALECSLDELREFLEADLVDVPVDREFKESLRTRLWEMIQNRERLRSFRTKEN